MGHLSSPTWMAVGRVFEVKPASPQGVEIGYCCTFSTAEQDECLEHSMGKHSMCQVWSCMSNVASAEQLFKKWHGNSNVKVHAMLPSLIYFE